MTNIENDYSSIFNEKIHTDKMVSEINDCIKLTEFVNNIVLKAKIKKEELTEKQKKIINDCLDEINKKLCQYVESLKYNFEASKLFLNGQDVLKQ